MIWVPMVNTGLSEVIGSWKTKASERPRSRRSASGAELGRGPGRRTARARVNLARRGSSCAIRARQHRLAGARLADDPERAPGRQGESVRRRPR